MVESEHHCQLNKGGFALGVTAMMIALYAICTFFVAFWPATAMNILGWMIHLVGAEKFVDVQITLGGFFIALIPIVFYSFIGAWILAWLHNRFSN